MQVVLNANLRADLESRFPLEDRTVTLAGREWRLSAVPLDGLLAVVGHDADVETFPHGLLLWPAAFLLAARLAEEPAQVTGKRVLEIGSGVGLPGITARRLGADVTQTDYQADALLLTQINGVQNGLSDIPRFQADWRDFPDCGPFDLILGADVLYKRDQRPVLAALFTRLLLPGGTILLADRIPAHIHYFAERLERAGWTCARDSRTIEWEDEEKEIGVLAAQRPTTDDRPEQGTEDGGQGTGKLPTHDSAPNTEHQTPNTDRRADTRPAPTDH